MSGAGLTPADFAVLSASSGSGTGPYYAAAHLQGLGGGTDSTWIGAGSAPVPEPSTVLAGLALLAPFGASTLRLTRKCRAAKNGSSAGLEG